MAAKVEILHLGLLSPEHIYLPDPDDDEVQS